MTAEKGRTRRIIIFTALIAATVLFVCFVLPSLIVWILPFIFAFLIAKIIEPVVGFLNKKLKIPKKLASGVMVAVVVVLIVWLVSAVISRVVTEIANLVAQADVLSAQITDVFEGWRDFILSHAGENFAAYINTQIDLSNIGVTVSNYLTGYIWPTIEKLLDVVKSLPNVIIFIVALFLGAYFISSDSEAITMAMRSRVPKKAMVHFVGVKKGMSRALWGYIRAQLILIGITFVECTIGFSLIGGPIGGYALILGLSISIIDALPILGTGTVLIPWGIAALITGNTRLGIYLLVLYGICLLVRQLLEPRIVSGQIGMHPLITLMTMYAGLKIIGVLGMIVGPVLALIIKNLADGGLFSAIWYWVKEGGVPPQDDEKTD